MTEQKETGKGEAESQKVFFRLPFLLLFRRFIPENGRKLLLSVRTQYSKDNQKNTGF